MHQTIDDFIASIRLEGRETTATGYRHMLHFFDDWLRERKLEPLRITTDHLRAYQRWIAEEYRSADGESLGRGTQATRLATVKAYYAWLERRGLVIQDIAKAVKLPRTIKGPVTHDHLELQEATALLQTQARHAQQYKEGSYRWSKEVQNLAILCAALATGRRKTGLRNLNVAWVNFERNELRFERDKGKPGRVLPVAPWCMSILKIHIDRARPVLDHHQDNDALFVGRDGPRIGGNTLTNLVDEVVQRTVVANPDLTDLAAKRVKPHSFRVTYSTMLFEGGCNIRSVNELMMHESLSTTARYTPIPVENLRRVCRTAHPRA